MNLWTLTLARVALGHRDVSKICRTLFLGCAITVPCKPGQKNRAGQIDVDTLHDMMPRTQWQMHSGVEHNGINGMTMNGVYVVLYCIEPLQIGVFMR